MTGSYGFLFQAYLFRQAVVPAGIAHSEYDNSAVARSLSLPWRFSRREVIATLQASAIVNQINH
ncbi:hypothetical protein TU78_01390 [Pseudomonas taetrolens]|uniref:Uncharacterized protein n=1 Tax=Pseudomonas taetrolens TaxID=47884 RepID=A0A0J6GPR4_PSETA|nr:hypothetical protein TU78_01390 [Pseudomonas taetrolens]